MSNCASSITLNKPSWEHNNSTLKEDRAVPLHAAPLTIVPFASATSSPVFCKRCSSAMLKAHTMPLQDALRCQDEVRAYSQCAQQIFAGN